MPKGIYIHSEKQLNNLKKNKGVPMKEETKQKISLANKGRKLTEAHKEKIRQRMLRNPVKAFLGKPHFAIRGEKHPNWKGGVSKRNKTERRFLMQTLEYVTWRRKVFERDNYTCQSCRVVGGNLEADHIKSWAGYPELRYEISNGQTLCTPCHKKTETWGYKSRGRFLRRDVEDIENEGLTLG